MKTEDEEKEKYLATQKRRIERAEKDGWRNIQAVYIKYGDASYYNDDDVLELRGISPNGDFDYVPKYPLQRLIVSNRKTDDCTYYFDDLTPILFESKDTAEMFFISTLIEKQREYNENEERVVNGGEYRFVDTRFELFGIEFDIHSDPKFYTLDEWFANAYSPKKSET